MKAKELIAILQKAPDAEVGFSGNYPEVEDFLAPDDIELVDGVWKIDAPYVADLD